MRSDVQETPCRFDWRSFDVKVEPSFREIHPSGDSPQPKPGVARMRFMMIVKANKDSEAGKMPGEELLSAMGKYNEEQLKAGVLLDLAGLEANSEGARIKFSGEKRTVVDRPFTESRELIAGYWVIQVKLREEALEWAKRAPNPYDEGQEVSSSSWTTSGPARRSIAPAKRSASQGS